ncbi:embigin-like isoform X2 [Scyliorhinus canicula]|uniref:embigin-like isoform X2 n=1 Tax=Scyliorhinus canicula TaxID=7830 RepID=UPI0018F78C9F|nr:embigin-like isoform X2 [Scyliorhinus canicula]
MTEPSLKHTLSVIFLIGSFRGQVESGQPQDATSEPNILMGNGKHLETIHLSESSRLTPKTVNITKVTKIMLSCSLTLPVAQTPPITGTWEKDGNRIEKREVDFDEIAGSLSQKYEFDFQNGSDAGNYSCVFDTNPKSEGRFEVQIPPIWTKNEKEIRSDGDHVNLTCKSGQYIPLYWIWSKEVKGSKVALINETGDQFYIHSNGNKSSLLIKSLIMDNSTYYHCDAVYEVGFSGLRIHLKVNSLLAAVIPFVCIVAEVLVLVIFILACERRMKQKDDLAEGEIFPEKLAAEELIDSAENGARHRKVEPASVQPHLPQFFPSPNIYHWLTTGRPGASIQNLAADPNTEPHHKGTGEE